MKIVSKLPASKNKPKAFSLIELLVVIIIIGILAAGITKGSMLITRARLVNARSLTKSSPVLVMEGLMLWLETTSEESFDKTETSKSSPVSIWYDINPQLSQKNAVQPELSYRPSYLEEGINNLPSLHFDGNLACINAPLNITPGAQPNITIFAVFKNITNGVISGLLGNDSGWGRFIIIGGYIGAGTSLGSWINPIPNLGTVGQAQIVSYISRSGVANGTSVNVNRHLDFTTYTENFLYNQIYTDFTIGAHRDHYQSLDSTGCNPDETANVDVGEVIVFDRALTTAERILIEDYLASKWGIKLTQ